MPKTSEKLNHLREERNKLRRQLATVLDDQEKFRTRYKATEDALKLFANRAEELRTKIADTEAAIKVELRTAYS